MKKVLFVCYGLGIGGIEKCLVNLINVLPENQFEIDLLLMNPEYDLTKEIKRRVNYLDRFKYVMNTTDTMNEIASHGGFLRNMGTFLRYCIFRLSVKMGGDSWKCFRRTPQKYDVAIAYSHHDYSPNYVIDKVDAAKKVLWYHNGKYENTGKNYLRDKRYYDGFEYIVAVSSDCAEVLKHSFPNYQQKIIILRNICDVDSIIAKSKAFTPYDSNTIHITTVGRLTKEKGADIAVEACKRLIDKGCQFCWHWIGDGNQRNEMDQLIVSNNLTDTFIIEGNQNNPYPFIHNCDIYVQPSYYEAYSTTITEAKVLKKPIVTTDVGGMRDQIEDGVNGFIVPIDIDALADKVELLIKNKEMRYSFSDSLSEDYIDNKRYLKEYYNTVFS